MKVCTDACLFGAWVAQIARQSITDPAAKALDIGTGTGLLALMLVQQFAGSVDAIDIDAAAVQQATENTAVSPWKEKINVHHQSVAQWEPTGYDLIISNPPFYEQDLKSPHPQKNLAHHDTGLTLGELWKKVRNCIRADGVFALLLPYRRLEACLQHASDNGFFLCEKILVHQTEKHAPFRVMLLFGLTETVTQSSSIIIKQEAKYTDAFTALLKDYYLAL